VVPVVVAFEARRDNILDGLGQCIAAMVGAARFNQATGIPLPAVFGVITTGTNWKSLRLAGQTVASELPEYTLPQVDHILGILTHIVGPVPPAVAA
jgi:hypothetical protein